MRTEARPGAASARRIDAHQHFWDLQVRDQPWTADLPVLRRSFRPADLAPLLAAHAVAGTILVQTVTETDETQELLALATEHPWILGVVGWTDLTSPGVEGELARLRALPGGDRLVGIRHQVQEEADPRWLVRDDVLKGIAEVGRAGLVHEVVVTHQQLPACVEAVRAVDGARWVLDHGGKPPIADGTFEPWREQITALAASRDVAVKLSGLVTEADPDVTIDDLRRWSDHLLETFGPRRLMVGSDWPVCLLRMSYDQVSDLYEELVADLGEEDRAQVLGGTAGRWYGLD